MRALTYHGPHDVRHEEVADPSLRGSDGAIVAISCCAICGSDLHIYSGHGFSTELGYCVGHEAVGEVVEAGRAVTRFKVGDRVMVPASVGCGSCLMCRGGLVLRCERSEFDCYGLSSKLPGSQAQAVAVPHADCNLVALPESVSDEAAVVLTDSGPTGWYGARRARVAPGDTVAVIGLGPVGLMSVLASITMGAARVLAIDLVPSRRDAAERLGAEPIAGDDPVLEVRERTGGVGVDAAIEAVGSDATIATALRLARAGGRVSVIGVNQGMSLPYPMALAQIKELEFHTGLCSVQRELPALLALTESGRIDPTFVISHRMRLADGPEAYQLFNSREDGVSKVVLDPRDQVPRREQQHRGPERQGRSRHRRQPRHRP